ncbi:MAG TPA: hypothetical protein VKV73_27765 [Chloroflexota bacterium]|nr:hypothetical protein [Chloroflexota bacterium]
MTTVEPDEQGTTARIEPPLTSTAPSPSAAPPAATPPLAEPPEAEKAPVEVPRADGPVARVVEPPADVVVLPTTSAPNPQDVVFVPLAVNVGDGFKFGCGFFLAMVLAMLIGFVLLATLFVLTSLFGLNLPISR